MKSTTRRNRGTKPSAPTVGKGRWLPSENTRPQTFADRRAVSNKRACRGKITSDFA